MFLVLLDVAINVAFPYPQNQQRPDKLQNYFDYGRSTVAKVRRLIGDDDSHAGPLATAGWFIEKPAESKRHSNGVKITFYGMSFSDHIASIIAQQEPTYNIEKYAGPGAPLNHSYAYYLHHRPHQKNEVVVLGILASSLEKINTMTHMTVNFEGPATHFYPRYRLRENNSLLTVAPPVDSLSALRNALNDNTRWEQVIDELKQHDSFYYPLIFRQNLSDRSALMRLIKRGLAQRQSGIYQHRYHTRTGFTNHDRMIDVSRVILRTFARQVREDGAIPYVILFNDRNYSDHLYQTLHQTLENSSVPFYSTHTDFPADDFTNFIADGHFKTEIDKQIAYKVLIDIKRLLAL